VKSSRLPTYFVLAAMTAAVLSACGGSGGGGGASTPAPVANAVPAPVVTVSVPASVGQSTVSGTITGFGSVIG
jgi:hypothetical protein